jgi:hypothetical protein
MADLIEQLRERRRAAIVGAPLPVQMPAVPAGSVPAGGNMIEALRERRRLQPVTAPPAPALPSEAEVMASFEKLGQEDPLERADWRNIARAVVQLKSSPDVGEEERKLAEQIMQAYGDQLRPHVDLAAGEDWWEQNYVEPPEPGGLKGVLKDIMDVPGVTGLLETLDRPSQAMLNTIAGVRAAIDQDDGISAGDALRYAGSSLGNTFNWEEDWAERTLTTSEGEQISFDIDDDGTLNFREALGRDPDDGGLLAGAFDLAGVILTDPTTYFGVGLAGRAMRGLKLLETAGGQTGKALAQAIRVGGWNSLDDVSQEFVETTIRSQLNESARRLIALRDLPDAQRRTALRALGRSDDALRRSAERSVDRALGGIRRGGQRGLRFFGSTIPGTPYIWDVMERAGITGRVRYRQVPAAQAAADGVEEIADLTDNDLIDIVETAARDPHPYLRAGGEDQLDPDVLYSTTPTPDQLRIRFEEDLPEFLRPGVIEQEQLEILFPDATPVQLSMAFPEIVPPPGPELLPPASATPNIPRGAGRFEAAQAAVRSNNARRGAQTRAGAGAVPFETGTVADDSVADLVDRPWTPDPEVAARRLTGQDLRGLDRAIPLNHPRARNITRSEKMLILELQDRGLEPFYDEVSDTFKVRAESGRTYAFARRSEEPRLREHSIYLTPEGVGSRLPVPVDQAALPPRFTLNQGAARQLDMDEAVAAQPRPRPDFEAGAAQADELPFEGTVPGTNFDPDNWVPDEAIDELVTPVQGSLFDDMSEQTQRLFDPDTIAEDLSTKVAERIPRSEWVLELSDPGLIDRLLDTRVMMALRYALVPRARLRTALARLSKADVQEFERTVATNIARHERESVDALLRLEGKLTRKAVREAGSREELLRTLNTALANPGQWDEIYQAAGPRVRTALDTVRQIREEIYEATIRGGADPKKLAKVKDAYIPRVVSARARRQLNDILRRGGEPAQRIREAFNAEGIEIADRIGRDAIDTTQSGFLLKRGLAQDVNDLFEVNRQAGAWLRETAGVDIDDLFETDVLRAFAIRHRAAMEAAMRADLVGSLADITVGDGFRAAYIVPKEIADAPGYLRSMGVSPGAYDVWMTTPDGTRHYVRHEMVEEIQNSARFLDNQQNLGKFRRFIDDWNGLWASYATVPLIGFGFHARNMTGNIFNMMLAGFNDPRTFADAFRIQKAGSAIREQMAETGEDFLTAARTLGFNEDITKIILEARDMGVYSGGKVGDIFTEARLGETRSRADRFNPISQRNFIISSGRGFGEAIENNARLALYIDGIRKGMTPEVAAERVRKYLFDYSDLTNFERNNLRVLSRFYTFMRKNTALQFATLAMYPGRVLNAQRIADFFVEEFFPVAEDAENYLLPGYAQELRDTAVRTVPGGSEMRAIINVDTPLVGAFRAVNQLGSLASTIPLLDKALPPVLAFGDRQERFGNAVSLFSGGPATAVNYLMGGTFGRDPFSMARLDDSASSQWVRFANIFAPVVGKVQREGEKFGAWGDDQGDAAVRLMNALTGLYTLQLTPEGQDRTRNAIASELYDAIRQLRDAGVDVPTFEELQQAGTLELQSRALEAIVYGELPEDVTRAMEGIIGADAMEAGGLIRQTPLAESEELTEADIVRMRDDWIFAIERQRAQQGLPPLSEQERANLVLLAPWAPTNTDVEQWGAQPGQLPSQNRFLPSAESQGLSNEQVEQRIDLIAAGFGLSADRIRQIRPVLPEAQQILNEGLAAGVSPSEIGAYLTQRLSRAERGIIFGADSLERLRDGTYTPEDYRRAQNAAWERAAELTVIMQLFLGRQPTQEEIAQYTLWNELTLTEQEIVGLQRRPKFPTTQDIRSDAQVASDARNMLGTVLTGVTSGPSLVDD